MIVLNVEKRPATVIDQGISPGEDDIRRLKFEVDCVGIVLLMCEKRFLGVSEGRRSGCEQINEGFHERYLKDLHLVTKLYFSKSGQSK
jgi:hypothetical protein